MWYPLSCELQTQQRLPQLAGLHQSNPLTFMTSPTVSTSTVLPPEHIKQPLGSLGIYCWLQAPKKTFTNFTCRFVYLTITWYFVKQALYFLGEIGKIPRSAKMYKTITKFSFFYWTAARFNKKKTDRNVISLTGKKSFSVWGIFSSSFSNHSKSNPSLAPFTIFKRLALFPANQGFCWRERNRVRSQLIHAELQVHSFAHFCRPSNLSWRHVYCFCRFYCPRSRTVVWS